MNPEMTGIAYTNLDALRMRVFMSEVTITDQPEYEAGAIVPAAELWRPNMDDLTPFLATENTPDNGAVEVFAYSQAVKDAMKDSDAEYLIRTDCQPNQLTTTENKHNNSQRPGLHIDSKEDLPLRDRHLSQRRIGLNRGPGRRFLLIGSVDVFDMARLVGIDDSHTPATSDVRYYIDLQREHPKRLPPLRCLWLLMRPGEGYMAPTENIIHDGSTAHIADPSTIHFWLNAPARGRLGSVV